MMCPDCGCDINSRISECPNCHHIFFVTEKIDESAISESDYIRNKQLELKKRELDLKERELQMLNAIGQIEAINAREKAFANFLHVVNHKQK